MTLLLLCRCAGSSPIIGVVGVGIDDAASFVLVCRKFSHNWCGGCGN